MRRRQQKYLGKERRIAIRKGAFTNRKGYIPKPGGIVRVRKEDIMTGGQVTAEKQITPIFQALNRLDKSISTLSDVTMDLRGQLTPVSSSADTVEKDAEPPRESFGSSGVCNRISEAADAIDGLIRRCREIAGGLEV